MTTYEPCGYRAKRTGAMIPRFDSYFRRFARDDEGNKMNAQEFEEWWPLHFEVVYREVDDLST